MGRFTSVVVACATVAMIATAAPAATTGGYTSFFVFGDSLSDPGNLFASTGGTVPGKPYADGRFSNGPVWAESVAAQFSSAGKVTANFAYGGATAIENDDSIPDLGLQVSLFEQTVPDAALGDSALAAIWMGANDLIGALEAIVAGTLDSDGVIGAAVAAAKGVAGAIATLSGGGVTSFVVLNLPDLGKVPAYAGTVLSPLASAATAAYNATLVTELAALKAGGLDIVEIDIAGLYDDLLADPAAFGLLDASTPCYIPDVVTCDADVASQLAFFDPLHPSDTVHTVIAGVVTEAIAPVPLPASSILLLGALAGMALARRRLTLV
jgi:phospholipase/lecithinase/hemolysin